MKIVRKWKNSEKPAQQVILFFNGWGLDHTPYQLLQTESDVVFLQEYQSLNPPENFISSLRIYSKVIVVAFSFGVWVWSQIQHKLGNVVKKIIINGTSLPVDSNEGIPPAIFRKTLDHLDSRTLHQFYRNMLHPRAEYWEWFEKYFPKTDVDQCILSLRWFSEMIHTAPPKPVDADVILISRHDRIFPPRNQINHWKDQKKIRLLDSGHFPFFDFSSWEEILDDDGNF